MQGSDSFQQIGNARSQLFPVERLAEHWHIRKAGLDRLGGGMAGYKEDGEPLTTCPDGLRHGRAAHLRHCEVNDQQTDRLIGLQYSEGVPSVRNRQHMIAFGLERVADEFEN